MSTESECDKKFKRKLYTAWRWDTQVSYNNIISIVNAQYDKVSKKQLHVA